MEGSTGLSDSTADVMRRHQRQLRTLLIQLLALRPKGLTSLF